MSQTKFPAVGHSYEVEFGGGNAFIFKFNSDSEMVFTKIAQPRKGFAETVKFTHKPIRDDVFLVYWQKADKATVVHVEDFGKCEIYSNITGPDGSFFNGSSNLKKIS